MRCEVCGSTEFNENSGFHFCTECGTQNKDGQVIEYEGYLGGVDNFANVTKIKNVVINKENKDQLTSWEEYNYILIGIVDELINLGAKEELKITTLQLWTTYLRINEVAFFSRREPRIPKLGASFKIRDAEILYNLKRAKRRTKRKIDSGASNSDGASTVFSRRSLKRSQGDLARSEYETRINERESNDSLSVLNRSMTATSEDSSSCVSSASSSRKNVRIEFSRLSRRLLKKVMPKKHIRKHENDGQIDCHAFRRGNLSLSYHPHVVTRNMVYELIYLALNQIGDTIQVGDIIRYIREGHLTFIKVDKFFPDNVQNQQMQNNFNSSSSAAPSHEFLRYGAENQAHLLHVDLKLPDFTLLTKRYVEELSLPHDVHKMVETLLMLCPPEMKLRSKRGYKKTPNYEGRAIAMVLFVVKLVFGLDDKRENEISESARLLNAKLKKLKSDRKPLFVWKDWMRFIEMRNVILSQCHYPTCCAEDPDSPDSAHLYLDFLHQQGLTDMEVRGRGGKCFEGLRNMETVFSHATSLHGINTDRSSLMFQPSLTPKKSYLDRLLTDAVMATNLYIPDFMRDDPSKSDFVPFLNTKKLRSDLQTLGIRLQTEIVMWNDRLSFNPVFVRHFPEVSKIFNDKIMFMDYKHDISNEDWLAELKHNEAHKQELRACEKSDHKERIRNRLAQQQEENRCLREQKILNQKNRTTKPIFSKEIDLNKSQELFDDGDTALLNDTIPAAQISSKPRRDIDESVPLFEISPLSDDEDDQDYTDTVTLKVTNYEHWLCMGNQLAMNKLHFTNLCSQLPLNFQWMLRQCAHIVQCHEREVYQELQVLENQYMHVLKSFGHMTNTLMYQETKNREHVPGMSKLSNTLRKYW